MSGASSSRTSRASVSALPSFDFAAWISASVRFSQNERLPRQGRNQPSSSWNATTSTPTPASPLASIDGASDLEAVDDAQRTVEPAALRNRVRMRTDEHRAVYIGIASVDVPDTIHLRGKAGFAHPAHQPATRFDIGGGQRHAVHARAEFADARKRAQVGDEAAGVDRRHRCISRKPMSHQAPLRVSICARSRCNPSRRSSSAIVKATRT